MWRKHGTFSHTLKSLAIIAFITLTSSVKAYNPVNNHPYHDSDGLFQVSNQLGASIPGFYPVFDLYSYWDTGNLDPYKFDFKTIGGVVELPVLESDCGFCLPIDGNMTSPFGYRWGKQHAGVDLDLETGDTVSAAFDGVVRMSMWYYGYGNCIVIRHHNGIETLYGHLSKRLVNSGDLVNAGQIIGLGGSTGHSTGSHLHFETRFMGKAFNPENLIDFRRDSLLMDTLTFDTNSFTAPPPQVYYKKKGRSRGYYKSSTYRRPTSPARKSSYKK